MKVKILAFFLLMISLAALLSGCARSLTYSYYIDKTGSVHYDYTLTYDASSADAETVLQEARSAMEEMIQANGWEEVAEINEEEAGKISLFITYDSLTDLYISRGYTGKEKADDDPGEKRGVLVYYDSESENPYSALSREIRSFLPAEYAAMPDPAQLYYVFGTQYSTVLSNADSVEKRNGIYYHTWEISASEPSEILIRQIGLNGTLLYVLIISVFVLSLAVFFVIIYFTDRKNKKKFSSVSSSGGDPFAGFRDSEGDFFTEEK